MGVTTIPSAGIRSLNGVVGNGGEVTLTSTDASVTITPNLSLKTINLMASTAVDHFSYSKIVSGQTITIPTNQQMLVYEEEEIEGTGDLIIDGELVVIA